MGLAVRAWARLLILVRLEGLPGACWLVVILIVDARHIAYFTLLAVEFKAMAAFVDWHPSIPFPIGWQSAEY